MSSEKSYKRGEVIFKENDSASDGAFIVQSGIVSLSIDRGDQSIPLGQVQAGQIVGEESLWGATGRYASARANNNEVILVPLPNSVVTTLWASASPLLRLFGQGVLAKCRSILDAIRRARLEADPTPCPPAAITPLFSVLFHVMIYTGTEKPGGGVTVVWPAYKKYSQRIFLESPVRLEQAVNILVKVGMAKLEFVPCETDPEAPDELGFVHFTKVQELRGFVNFLEEVALGKAQLEQAAGKHREILDEIAGWNSRGRVEAPIHA